jgi:hypothetical protein
MRTIIEKILAKIWNRLIARQRRVIRERLLDLGLRHSEDGGASGRIGVAQSRRAEHVAILGKTGTGKSSLLRYLCQQDIEAGRGFVAFDLHGDIAPFVLGAAAKQEQALREDLSEKLIVIDPSDPEFSVGFNPLASAIASVGFIQIAEFAQVLKHRWHLDSFGARTDELLRNALYVLAENNLTLLELAPLLSNSAFRVSCLKQIENAEVKQYFELRYDQASEPMRATMREPILNKTSAFTADPHFRHIVGQQTSTFSVLDAIDKGRWIVLNLHKGRLGEQVVTLGSLFFTLIKNAVFSRGSRELFTLYCDEVQNLVAFASGFDTLLSESRKFDVGVVSANQFLDQYPPEMRSAILAIGTHVFFQLSSGDAQQIAGALDGGKPLAELLKSLPRRHMVVKSGHERWQHAVVPTMNDPKADYADLYERCRVRWTRKRSEIETEIAKRQAAIGRTSNEVLDGWD